MIAPPATLGMLGGGQFGRFFVIAAHEMGYKVAVLDPDPHSPAGQIADHHLIAAWDDQDALNRMAELCAAVTTEFENVPADTLAYLSKFVPVRPGAEAVAICQNRSAEKGFLRQHGFPHAPYADIRAEDDVRNANAGLFPGILKVARFGYDGKGQARVRDRDEALIAFRQLKGEPCVLEQMLPLDYEVSVVLARDEPARSSAFPRPRTATATASSTCPSPRRAPRVACAAMPRRLPKASRRRWATSARSASSSSSSMASSMSTRWRRARTTPATTPSTPASPTSSSSRCARCAACRWARRGPTRRR